jgi:hypothetical protein
MKQKAFLREKLRVYRMFKIPSIYNCYKNIHIMQHLEGSGTPVLYIGRAYCYPPDVALYIFFSTNIGTEYFKHVAHSPFFSSKCRLFHIANFFDSCIIHILHTGCVKI